MIEAIERRGPLMHECRLPGEDRAGGTVPAHPNGIQVSRDRWLLVYATRHFRGNDDDCSIAYQLRADRPDGRLLREGMLARSVADRSPGGARVGPRYKKDHRSPLAFGVPRGARICGRPAVNASVFGISWSRVGREFDASRNHLGGTNVDSRRERCTQCVEWVQVRLNDAGDEIEALGPVGELRQRGFETGENVSSLPASAWVARGEIQPVPCDAGCREWVVCDQFSGRRFAAVKLAYDPPRGRYVWVDTGPSLFCPESGAAVVVRRRRRWQ